MANSQTLLIYYKELKKKKTKMENEMKNFVGLSAVLTGFNESIIAPGIDPINIKEEYLAAFIDNIGTDLTDEILLKYESLKAAGKTDREIGEGMLDDSNGEAFTMACRKLIFLWYSGAWPTIINQGTATVSSLLSAESFTQGLVWQVMQSHPMGDSDFRYGYWNEEPPALSAFTGNKN